MIRPAPLLPGAVNRERLVPYLLLAPAILTIVCVVALPLVFSLYTSFTPYRLTR